MDSPQKRFISKLMASKMSIALYGATAALAVAWLTDWKIVRQYIPYYREEETKKVDSDV